MTWFWIAMGVGFLVAVFVLWRWARHADRIEDDSSYVREEGSFTPYGSKYLDLITFRNRDDD